MPLYPFFTFPLYHEYTTTEHNNKYIKLKLGARAIHCLYSHFVRTIVTSLNDVITFTFFAKLMAFLILSKFHHTFSFIAVC